MDNAAVAGWKLWMKAACSDQTQDQPNYWTVSGHLPLDTHAQVTLIKLGSGLDIYESILPAIEQAEEEVVFVTCFWARSETLDRINDTLRRLSDKGSSQGRRIRVRICFSSLSLWQKLVHTRSLDGRLWPPSTWQKALGLPPPHVLSGLDLQIKSIFVLPFSVMHSKFIIIDRRSVFLPSCNVSWERWFEGCVQLRGPIVDHFVRFWQAFWSSQSDHSVLDEYAPAVLDKDMSPAIFLPSPHHAMNIFDSPWQTQSPRTPLNLFLLSLLDTASETVYIQTPNLTARPVLDKILITLERGVDICIVTSERLMILEQLVTARTTTARCVQWLARKHHQMLSRTRSRSAANHDVEALMATIGRLQVSYYKPRGNRHSTDPVQSHIKLSIADDEIIVLGSGNLDRASWVTSQELGVAILDRIFVRNFKTELDTAMQGRLKVVYEGM